jgi:hypothetical protein
MTGEKIRHRLNLSFKGGRSYLHGTDIIPALLELAGPVQEFSVQIYRMTSHRLVAEVASEAEVAALRRARELCVLMTCRAPGGGPVMLAVTEDRSERIGASVPYDEAAVVRTATRQDNRMTQGESAVGSFFERVVALNKRLLNELEGKTDWLFCALELNAVPRASIPLTLAMEGSGGRGVYKSRITAGDTDIGTIMFAKAPAS